MHPLIAQFLARATVVVLKQKLSELGFATSGNKSELILRVEEATKDMESNEIELHFANTNPDPPVAVRSDDEQNDDNDGDDGDDDSDQDDDDDDQLDQELQCLRRKLQKKKEIVTLKKQLAELNHSLEIPSSSCFFNFRDIEESLNTFSGDDNHDIMKWIQQIEDAAEVLNWSQKACFIYARRLLTGSAKLYLRTISVKTWKDLKTILMEEFDRKVSSAEVHNELRRRKRKHSETWQQYTFAMQEIAAAAKVEESDLIQYIIDGVSDSAVNKMVLYNANTLKDLKQAFKKYDKIKTTQFHNSFERRKPIEFNKTKSEIQLKCYNCNTVGHHINNCPRPRRPKGSCYKCGKMGHMSQDCKESIHAIEGAYSSLPPDDQSNENIFEFNIRYTFEEEDHPLKFECTLLSLLDSGSPISFIQEKFLPSSIIRQLTSDKYNFCGINGSTLCILGSTNLKIHFDENEINLEIYVVKNNSMSYPIILGRNFIKESNLEFKIEKKDTKMLQNETTHKESKKLMKSIERNDQGMFYNTNLEDEMFLKQILCIDVVNESEDIFNINNNLPFDIRERVKNILKPACFTNCDRPTRPIQNQLQKDKQVDLLQNRKQAEENIRKSQEYNKTYFDRKHKRPYVYKQGDYIMLRNNVAVAGVNKKLFSKYRGPYEIEKVLDNDRYIVRDLEGMQITRIPYRGICSPANMKPFFINPGD